jgi:translation initiation factor 3 subunit A
LETYDTEGLITIQVAQLEKEKKEVSERLRIISKRIDHTERAYRKEEQPLLAEDYQNQQMTDRETFESIQQARRELSRQTHQDDLETKSRLRRLLDDYHARKDVIIAKKKEEFAAKKAAAEKKIKEEKEKRLKSVLKAREEEKAKREKEEQLRLQKEAEEARIEAGLFFFSIAFFSIFFYTIWLTSFVNRASGRGRSSERGRGSCFSRC